MGTIDSFLCDMIVITFQIIMMDFNVVINLIKTILRDGDSQKLLFLPMDSPAGGSNRTTEAVILPVRGWGQKVQIKLVFNLVGRQFFHRPLFSLLHRQNTDRFFQPVDLNRLTVQKHIPQA